MAAAERCVMQTHKEAGIDGWATLIEYWARTRPDAPALTLEARGATTTTTYADLAHRIEATSGALRRRFPPGSRLALACPAGIDFVVGLLACFRAGLVAAPAPAPRIGRGGERLRAIAADCGAETVLTIAECMDSARGTGLAPLDIATLEGPPEAPPPPQRVAFLQYTSGSTAAPKGVMVSHQALWANQTTIADRFGHYVGAILVGWLPNYHDMGLVGDLLQPLFCGGTSIRLAPTAFLQRPLDWLDAISRWRAHTSGGPNFAYDLCVRAAREDRLAALKGLDLSSWKVAFNGAEPIRAATLDAFVERFRPFGFDPNALCPCYGLAESTLMVTGARRGEGAVVRRFSRAALANNKLVPATDADDNATRIVSCGEPKGWAQVRIVAEGRALEEGAVGEIWTSSDSVAEGYFANQSDSHTTFQASLNGETGRFLRTGDLGAILEGELYVVGRLKDVIIQNGANIHPADIEAAASTVAGVQAAAAAGLADGAGERIVLFVELTRAALREDFGESFFKALRLEIQRRTDAAVAGVVLLKPGALPRTSSGKVRRRACGESWAEGVLDGVAGADHGAHRFRKTVAA